MQFGEWWFFIFFWFLSYFFWVRKNEIIIEVIYLQLMRESKLLGICVCGIFCCCCCVCCLRNVKLELERNHREKDDPTTTISTLKKESSDNQPNVNGNALNWKPIRNAWRIYEIESYLTFKIGNHKSKRIVFFFDSLDFVDLLPLFCIVLAESHFTAQYFKSIIIIIYLSIIYWLLSTYNRINFNSGQFLVS